MTKVFSLLLISVAAALCACHHQDATPVSPVSPIPVLEFSKISFVKGEPFSSVDVTLIFQDGDGDMGFSFINEELNPPFNFNDYFKKSDGQPVPDAVALNKLIPVDELIRYSDRKVIDTLPPFDAPDGCKHWQLNSFSGMPADTMYRRINPHTFNVLIDLYVDDVLFDLTTVLCYDPGLNTRLWYDNNCLADPRCSWLSNRSSGTANVAMNLQWSTLFGGRKVKFAIYVYDHSLHKSNVVMTDEVLIEL